ncbi:hypothetical protein J6TS1_01980 [Siminovitchia terrae]|uniref:Uncharacterized protein n=1 Tax=Siminovitchia terrae TaxID=1914933 RepID=A0ABQ4KQK9_SIMTE|nr:hypothetical protein J22TS1_12110 [Siminovitchia terrae]GIN94328.1 hypothetical protein J6TS1_01980 [Siminovitchia terrae]
MNCHETKSYQIYKKYREINFENMMNKQRDCDKYPSIEIQPFKERQYWKSTGI